MFGRIKRSIWRTFLTILDWYCAKTGTTFYFAFENKERGWKHTGWNMKKEGLQNVLKHIDKIIGE